MGNAFTDSALIFLAALIAVLLAKAIVHNVPASARLF